MGHGYEAVVCSKMTAPAPGNGSQIDPSQSRQAFVVFICLANVC